MKKKSVKIGDNRREDGTFGPNNVANPNGRPKETPEMKVIKKATKDLIRDYKEKLAESLPQISPVLIAKAIAGDIQAIKELHDRVMGRPTEDITFKGEIKTENILSEEQINELLIGRTKTDSPGR